MGNSIGFIGSGNMGSRMARRLLAGAHDVRVCDRSEAALATFREQGAEVTTRPADCSGDEFVIVMVADGSQVVDVVSGPDGLEEGLSGR